MSENNHSSEKIKALAEQFICHPASRSIDDIELAGEIIIELMKRRDEMQAVLSLPVAAHTRIGQGNAVSCAFSSPESSYKFKAAIDAAIASEK